MVEKLMSAEEVAERLGVKPSTLAAWRCRRSVPLPFVKLGGLVKYRVEDVQRFIEVSLHGADDAGR